MLSREDQNDERETAGGPSLDGRADRRLIYHAHRGDEERLYIVSGRGQAEIGDKTFEVGPGDFMAFPTPSIGHHLKNPYDADLVYLMGGERGCVDVGEFPTVGKHIISATDGIYVADSDKLRHMSFTDWVKKP